MRKPRRRLVRALLALAALVLALAAAARLRAAGLPDAKIPVLLWRTVADDPGDNPATTAKSLFIEQVSDLWNGGFETPSPFRLRLYADWGWPLPDAPVLLRIGEPRADLLEKDGVEDILAGADFTAFVDLPCEDIEAGLPGLLSWDDVRAAAKRGILRFAPCESARTNATLSLEQAVGLFRERVGVRPAAVSGPNPSAGAPILFYGGEGVGHWCGGRGKHERCIRGALPSIPVLGGRHAFALELRQDAVDPALFGTIAISHPTGANPPPGGKPLVLLVYQKGDPMPIVDETLGEEREDGSLRPADPDETVEAPIPASPRFPLEVCVYDDTRTILYFRRTLFRNEAKRDPSWRPPVLDPEERLEIEPL